MNNEKKTIHENENIVNANALKRTGALLLDLLIMYAIMNLFWFAVHPVINNIYNYDAAVSENNKDMKRSYLVSLSAPLLADESNIDEVTITSNSIPVNKRGEASYNFYLKFLNSEITDPALKYSDEWFGINIYKVDDENSLFVRAETPTPKQYSSVTSEVVQSYDHFIAPGFAYKNAEVDAEAITNLYNNAYKDAISKYNTRPLVKTINEAVMIENSFLVVVASSIIFLALPIFLKHGQSLGKKVFKLGVATTHGYKAGALRLLLRYFAFLLINVLSNFLIPIVLPFISLTIMVFNKKARSLHDLVAGTRVVDLNKSVIYVNEEEYNQTIAQTAVRIEDVNEEVFAERFDEESGA